MEAVGHLTGGIAHDFNNLLAVILGRLQLLDEELPDKPELQDWVRSSIQAVDRGATLTKSLVAFSRRQTLAPIELDLNAVIDDIEAMLRQTLGEAYELRVSKAPELWPVAADPGQLQSALLNLVLNARDAMLKDATVTIATANATLDGEYAGTHNEVRPGDYVALIVSDTGIGMSHEVAQRAFEPFFTTKDVGKGSGLGLSMVYGFVKQSGGHVTIDSEPGEGTSVRVYLPRKVDGGQAPAKAASVPTATRGTATILVVEDNDDLRRLTRLQLERLGYTVHEAGHGAEAIRILRENLGIDLLLSDVLLPQGMSGPELAEVAMALLPKIKVIFMSGHSEQRGMLDRARKRGPIRLLQKPFHLDELATQIKAALE
jgi:CheY-like chemotaxis protein